MLIGNAVHNLDTKGRIVIPAKYREDFGASVYALKGVGGCIRLYPYEQFMKLVGFQTKLCKPYHPFTKGKVERLIQFIKVNFLAGRTFWNVTDLNESALEWCSKQPNAGFHSTAL